MTDDSRLDSALDRLSAGQTPRDEASSLGSEERRILQMAQALRGNSAIEEPSDEFRSALRAKMTPTTRSGVSRRTAVLGGLSALAAGVVGGVGLDHALQSTNQVAYDNVPLVPLDRGKWVHVARVEDVREDGIVTFETGSLVGYLVRRNGRIAAYSRVCTHMGCLLEYRDDLNALECPCHGATFELSGRFRQYAHSSQRLRRLPWIETRVRGNSIQVLSA